MKIVEMKCKNCGSLLNVDEDEKIVTCEFCHTSFAIDDEAQHIKHDNMFESGYEFEKGRIQAQNDEEEREEARIANEEFNNNFEETRKSMGLFGVFFVLFFMVCFGGICFIAYDLFTNSFSNSSTIKQQMDENDKMSFNINFETYSGTKEKFWVDNLLDEVVTNNKTNTERLVTVVYKDSVTNESDKIINIKHSIEDRKKYEVILDYDENGYVNKVTIMDI